MRRVAQASLTRSSFWCADGVHPHLREVKEKAKEKDSYQKGIVGKFDKSYQPEEGRQRWRQRR